MDPPTIAQTSKSPNDADAVGHAPSAQWQAGVRTGTLGYCAGDSAYIPCPQQLLSAVAAAPALE